jgi:hypothetical protein
LTEALAKAEHEPVRRRVAVLVSIGALFSVLLLYISSRTGSDAQSAATKKISPAQPLPKQQPEVGRQAQAPSAIVSAWAILLQVMGPLDDANADPAPGDTFNTLTLADFALKALAAANNKEPSPASRRIDEGLRTLTEQMTACRWAQDDADDAPRSKVTLHDIKSSCEQLQKLYEPAVLNQAGALSERYQCPMHPTVIGLKGAICPKCGMPLDTQVRFSIAGLASPGAALPRMVRAQVQTDTPLEVGVRVNAHLTLSGPGGDAVRPDQLCEVHAQKIHLLIIDGSFNDYHHEHPVPTDVAGRYDFSFTPQKPGTYRVWADVQPYLTGIQEYAMTVIPAATFEEPLCDTPDKLETTVNGLHYAIRFQQQVKAGETAMGTLQVTQADGTGFTRLEPVMDAFAHLVGFHENHQTVLHIHPEAPQPSSPNDRGGPELHFRLFAPMPGFFRLFVQVQCAGLQQFAAFALNVAPGNTPWIDQEPPHLH